ncbi:MAG: hypothetical protein ABI183_21000, partial [Polyangiaceae bacterium]
MSNRAVFRTTISSAGLIAFLVLGLTAVLGALVLLSPYSPGFSILALTLIVPGWFSLLMASSSTLVVGKDGVLIGSRLGRGELVSYRDLLGVDRYSESSLQRNNNELRYAGIT